MNRVTKVKPIYLGEGEYVVSALIIENPPEIWRIVGNTLTSKQVNKIISEVNSGLEVSDKKWLKCANADLHVYNYSIS